jgi:hypothetical protein
MTENKGPRQASQGSVLFDCVFSFSYMKKGCPDSWCSELICGTKISSHVGAPIDTLRYLVDRVAAFVLWESR